MIFAYLGPETMLPVASIVAGAVGALMMFWRSIVSAGRRVARSVSGFAGGRPKAATLPKEPGLSKLDS